MELSECVCVCIEMVLELAAFFRFDFGMPRTMTSHSATSSELLEWCEKEHFMTICGASGMESPTI